MYSDLILIVVTIVVVVVVMTAEVGAVLTAVIGHSFLLLDVKFVVACDTFSPYL